MSARAILKLSEVSTRTRMPLSTLRYLRHRGLGPPTWKLGGRVVAYEDEVETWLEEEHAKSRRPAPPQ